MLLGQLCAPIPVIRVVTIFAQKLPLVQTSVDGSYAPHIRPFGLVADDPESRRSFASTQLVQTRNCADGPAGVATIIFGVQQSGRPEPWPRAGVAAMSVPTQGRKR